MKIKSKKIGFVVLIAILAISVVSVIATPVSAQPEEVWNVTWGGTGADRVRAIATTEDSVYLAGTCVFTNTTNAAFPKYYGNIYIGRYLT